eukprot:m.166858 g.166858  ORF g.166858 m.166858 type:complete len:438 (-) comp25023_c3_seq3:33-1346(-)
MMMGRKTTMIHWQEAPPPPTTTAGSNSRPAQEVTPFDHLLRDEADLDNATLRRPSTNPTVRRDATRRRGLVEPSSDDTVVDTTRDPNAPTCTAAQYPAAVNPEKYATQRVRDGQMWQDHSSEKGRLSPNLLLDHLDDELQRKPNPTQTTTTDEDQENQAETASLTSLSSYTDSSTPNSPPNAKKSSTHNAGVNPPPAKVLSSNVGPTTPPNPSSSATSVTSREPRQENGHPQNGELPETDSMVTPTTRPVSNNGREKGHDSAKVGQRRSVGGHEVHDVSQLEQEDVHDDDGEDDKEHQELLRRMNAASLPKSGSSAFTDEPESEYMSLDAQRADKDYSEEDLYQAIDDVKADFVQQSLPHHDTSMPENDDDESDSEYLPVTDQEPNLREEALYQSIDDVLGKAVVIPEPEITRPKSQPISGKKRVVSQYFSPPGGDD